VHLTPRETDRLLLFTAAELARKRRARGLKLNYPEARALIADEIVEKARDGSNVAELMAEGARILTTDDVLPGVAELVGTVQVEAIFEDGQKLVTVHDAIRPLLSGEDGAGEPVPADSVPGQIIAAQGEMELNVNRPTARVTVSNEGDRPVQVGSHFHFFEANRALRFPRALAFGMHLDIPAGTSARFEPGQQMEVQLVALGGNGVVYGLNSMTDGPTTPEHIDQALARLRQGNFADEEEAS